MNEEKYEDIFVLNLSIMKCPKCGKEAEVMVETNPPYEVIYCKHCNNRIESAWFDIEITTVEAYRPAEKVYNFIIDKIKELNANGLKVTSSIIQVKEGYRSYNIRVFSSVASDMRKDKVIM